MILRPRTTIIKPPPNAIPELKDDATEDERVAWANAICNDPNIPSHVADEPPVYKLTDAPARVYETIDDLPTQGTSAFDEACASEAEKPVPPTDTYRAALEEIRERASQNSGKCYDCHSVAQLSLAVLTGSITDPSSFTVAPQSLGKVHFRYATLFHSFGAPFLVSLAVHLAPFIKEEQRFTAFFVGMALYSVVIGIPSLIQRVKKIR